MSCNEKTKIFGPRRPLLDEEYPQLCPFIDQIPRKSLSDPLSPYHFFDSLNMSKDDLGKFKEQLLTYASKNLVRINAYFDSPYLSKFQTDEVCIVDMLFQLYDHLCYFFFIPGDVFDNVRCKHWRDTWSLLGILFCQSCGSFHLPLLILPQDDKRKKRSN